MVTSCICIDSIILSLNHSKTNLTQANQSESKLIGSEGKDGSKGSIKFYKDLAEIKNTAKVIVEVEGTDKQEKRNYKGMPCIVSTVKVNQVFKGNKSLIEIKILQVENLDVPPENGQKLF